MTVINFQQALAQAQTASFKPLPDGTYDMVIVESTPTQSSTNKPMIKVKYRVETGPSAGKTVINNYTFTDDNPTALAIFFRHMAFHGLDASFFTQNPAWETVASTLMGRRVRLELGTRMWQGEPRNEVKRVMPPDAQAAAQAGPAAAAPTAPVAAPVQQAPAIQPPTMFAASQAPATAALPVTPPMMPAPTPPPMPAQAPVGPPPAPAPAPEPAPAPAPPAAPPGWKFENGQWVPDAAPAPAPPVESAPQPAPAGPVTPPPQPFEQPYQTDAGAIPPPPPVPT